MGINDELWDAIVFGERDVVAEIVQEEVDAGTDVVAMLNTTMIPALREVGNQFSRNEVFIPEMLVAAKAMQAGMDILEPLLVQSGREPVARVCIGSVKGDLHDIGKNLVVMMMEGAGFEVVDIGINNSVEEYLAALEKHQPDILGMSALLTTTMPYMKVVIDTLAEEGLRDKYIVMVGGAPLNEEFGEAVGADAYCRDAADAATTAVRLVNERRAVSA
jgi:methylmalonyl-CoA mutase cobalamin-binding domain/chain